jgi:hypothetical protein
MSKLRSPKSLECVGCGYKPKTFEEFELHAKNCDKLAKHLVKTYITVKRRIVLEGRR